MLLLSLCALCAAVIVTASNIPGISNGDYAVVGVLVILSTLFASIYTTRDLYKEN